MLPAHRRLGYVREEPLGRNVGVDLWHYRSPKGGSICQAMEMMSKYADPKQKWPYQQIHDANRDVLEL